MMFHTVNENLCWWVLIICESFHILAHSNVLLRIQPPPEKLLALKRLYFLWDFGSAFLAFAFTYQVGYPIYLQLLSFFHAVAHLFYVITWNKGFYALRIMKWSTKEYEGPWITADFFLTCTDILTHAVMVGGLIASVQKMTLAQEMLLL